MLERYSAKLGDWMKESEREWKRELDFTYLKDTVSS